MTWGEKLLQSLAVLHRMLQNLFQEASMENYPWWGWEEEEAHHCCWGGRAEAHGSQFVYQMLLNDGIKHWTEVQG